MTRRYELDLARIAAGSRRELSPYWWFLTACILSVPILAAVVWTVETLTKGH